MLVHILADYGQGDLAFAEVVQRIKRALPDADVVLTPIAPFATLAAGFCIAQLGLNEAPAGTLIYHNIAPRSDDKRARSGNAGERLAFARLITGVRVIGVLAGYTFSFIRDASEEIRWVSVSAEGSQFRSRDLFPSAVAQVAAGESSLLGKVPRTQIPAVPKAQIAYIDGYGNIKTTLEPEEVSFAPGTLLEVRIGRATQKATVANASFEIPVGEMALAPGSSGWRNAEGHLVRWMELFLRGGNAWEAFGRPPVGTSIEILSQLPSKRRRPRS
ncbi:MAG: SAM-dependent chlorinase/fluorinase [Nitrospirae bacterium]|nr:SAM-dependent chlorinase/fluorinase [Candidatus Manganitrophaceae bacterium]